jgi:hypothetical protein
VARPWWTEDASQISTGKIKPFTREAVKFQKLQGFSEEKPFPVLFVAYFERIAFSSGISGPSIPTNLQS